MPAAVIASGDGNGLPVAGLYKLELTHVDRLADGVVDEGFRVGLLHGWNDFGEGERDGGGDFGVQVVDSAVGDVNFAVDEVGVGAGSRGVKRPAEILEGQGHAAEGDVAIGMRILETLGFAGKMRGHFGQQIRLIEVEGVAQLELERAAEGFGAGQAQLEDGGGMAAKVCALLDRDKDQASLCGGRFER